MKQKTALRKNQFTNTSGIEVKNHYTAEDTPHASYESKLNDPGQYPYTRGVQETMYRGRLWTMRQYAGFGSARDSNQRYRILLEKGTGNPLRYNKENLLNPYFLVVSETKVPWREALNRAGLSPETVGG